MTISRIPLVLVTGFLGSGKTTMITRWMREGALERPALFVNEAADLAVDHHLLAQRGVVQLLDGGCACCCEPGNLASQIAELLCGIEGDGPSHVVIESSGIADPVAMLADLASHSYLRARLEPAVVITVVDALHGASCLLEFEEARNQVRLADHVIVSKTDIAAHDAIDALEIAVAALNLLAVVHKGNGGPPPLDILASAVGRAMPSRRGILPAHSHTRDLRQVSVKWDTSDLIDLAMVRAGLDALMRICGDDLVRVKGIVHSPQGMVAVHAVRQVVGPFQALPEESKPAQAGLAIFARGIRPEAMTAFWHSIAQLRLQRAPSIGQPRHDEA